MLKQLELIKSHVGLICFLVSVPLCFSQLNVGYLEVNWLESEDHTLSLIFPLSYFIQQRNFTGIFCLQNLFKCHILLCLGNNFGCGYWYTEHGTDWNQSDEKFPEYLRELVSSKQQQQQQQQQQHLVRKPLTDYDNTYIGTKIFMNGM